MANHEYQQFIIDVEHVQTMVERGTISEEEAQPLV
jgi:hypothetical protein